MVGRMERRKPLREFLNALVIRTLLNSGLMVLAQNMCVVMGPIVDFADSAERMSVVGFGEIDSIVFLAGPAGHADVLSVLEVAVGLQLLAVDAEDKGVREVEPVVVELRVGAFHGLRASGYSGTEAEHSGLADFAGGSAEAG